MNGAVPSDIDKSPSLLAPTRTRKMVSPAHEATAEHLTASAMSKVVKFIKKNVSTSTASKTAVVSDSQWEYALSANNIFEQLDTAVSSLSADAETDLTDIMTPVPVTLAMGEGASDEVTVATSAPAEEQPVLVTGFDASAEKILWTQLELHNYDTFNVLYQAIAVEASKAAHDKLKALDELLKDADDGSKKWRSDLDADKFREGYALWKLIEKAPRTLVIKVKAEIRESKVKYTVDGSTTVSYRSYPKDIKIPGASISVKLKSGGVSIIKY